MLKSHQPVKLPSCLQTAASAAPSPGTSPSCVASHGRAITHTKAAPGPLLSSQPWAPGAIPRQESQRGLWAIIPGRHTPTPTAGTRVPSPSRPSLSPCETSTDPFPKSGPEDLGQVVSAWGFQFQGAGLPRGHLDASLAPPSTLRLGELLTLSFHIHKMGTMVPNPQDSSKTGTEHGNLGGLGQRVRDGALCVLQSTEGPTSQLQPHGGRPPLACHRPTEPPACYGPTEAPPACHGPTEAPLVSATAPPCLPSPQGGPRELCHLYVGPPASAISEEDRLIRGRGWLVHQCHFLSRDLSHREWDHGHCSAMQFPLGPCPRPKPLFSAAWEKTPTLNT